MMPTTIIYTAIAVCVAGVKKVVRLLFFLFNQSELKQTATSMLVRIVKKLKKRTIVSGTTVTRFWSMSTNCSKTASQAIKAPPAVIVFFSLTDFIKNIS